MDSEPTNGKLFCSPEQHYNINHMTEKRRRHPVSQQLLRTQLTTVANKILFLYSWSALHTAKFVFFKTKCCNDYL